MNILTTLKETYADGPGIRYSIYVAGCEHHCKGCHNPESWDFNQGTPYEECIDEIIEEIRDNPMLTGITLSGGDPFFCASDLVVLLQLLKETFPEKNIWVYTGFTFEELLLKSKTDPNTLKCFDYIDTIVDGRYDETLREEVTFRGSSNQCFIHPLDEIKKRRGDK